MDFTELAEAFAAEVVRDDGARALPRRFTIRRPDRPDVEVEAEYAGPQCVAVSLSVDRPGTWGLPPITLRREGKLDRRGKALGLNREVQIGEARFDAAVYIVSAAPDVTIREVLAPAEARAAVTAMLQGAPSELVIGHGKIVARVEGASLEDLPALRMVVDYLAFLQEAVAVPKDIPVVAARPQRRLARRLAALGVVWLGLFAAALLLDPPPMLAWEPLLLALGLGGLVCLVCLALIVALLRGGAESLRWIMVCAGLCVPVAPVAGMRVALIANAWLDEGPATTTAVTAAACEPYVGGAALELEGLAADGGRTRLDVPEDRIRGELAAGQATVVLVTRPGAFGWPWLVEVAAGP